MDPQPHIRERQSESEGVHFENAMSKMHRRVEYSRPPREVMAQATVPLPRSTLTAEKAEWHVKDLLSTAPAPHQQCCGARQTERPRAPRDVERQTGVDTGDALPTRCGATLSEP
ncbi:hypothetical protein PSPO01_04340 [Paraphaeosphaeria sporulosa]